MKKWQKAALVSTTVYICLVSWIISDINVSAGDKALISAVGIVLVFFSTVMTYDLTKDK